MAFNIRVYGILKNSNNEVLLSDERRFGKEFTKFPGGGLEEGEGIKDCLIREFQEELSVEIKVKELIYLTDFYQKSAFHFDDQIISVYYEVSVENTEAIKATKIPFDFNQGEIESHRWVKLSDLQKKDVTFPIDKKVVGILTNDN
ncbi:NUDIX domain-containing protein [Brumimicrobium oceani]|uniref:NUDIX hydrolase n=1 Tax=Brumimicrobium oceani TaxID=2100725 RepID=A0A2U2XEG8_9FLAO|nr:NUDIX hydrolase [Brumimicrobium oceani]PWH86137.1 NUDIX hydrolase [Brumimicrobium oceani]